MDYNHNDLGINSGGGSSLGSGNNNGMEYKHNGVMDNYKQGDNDYGKRNDTDRLILPFMMPFYFLSEKAGIYYHVYKEFTGALEKVFKERVFTDNNPVTGITEAKIDKFAFAPTKRYQRGALVSFMIVALLTLIAVLVSKITVVSLIMSLIVNYVLIASFYVDLWFPATNYTYSSKKFADERLPVTQTFYENYILNFNLTEKVYFFTLVMAWCIVFGTLIFKDTIEYTLKFDTGILSSLGWYVFASSLILPTAFLILYYYQRIKVINKADMQREDLIEEIRNATKTNFDIARARLRDYK